jgi:NADPH:quinone reductase and related Zn-dependent oxidoreductases
VVTALGMGTAGIAVGDEVFGLTDPYRDAAAAEYVAVEARNLARKPQTVDHVHAAAVPRAGLTAWQALFDHGKLARGRRWSSTARAARSGRRRSSWPAGPAPR